VKILGRLTRDWPPSKAPVVSLRKKLYLHCVVLVGPRNGFGSDFSILQK